MIHPFYSSSLSNSIAFTFLARLFGTPGPLVFGCGALFPVRSRIYLNKLFTAVKSLQLMDIHVLAGCVETGLDPGLGDTCGRLAGVLSELSSLSFRDSWRVSENSAADAGTGSPKHSDGVLSLLSQTLTGSERHQLG